MYSSPGMPIGVSASRPSSTWMRVFATGLPMGTVGSPGRQAWCVTSTPASVGPYRSSSSTPGSRSKKRSRTSVSSASPLHTTRRTLPQRRVSPASRNAWSMEGTKCSVVTPSRSISSDRYCGSRCPSGFASTSRAPASSGQKNSHTETSKLNGVFCSTTSSAVSPYCRCPQRRRLTMPRWAFIAPLGCPVEPEV
jgi:hypothetical protein